MRLNVVVWGGVKAASGKENRASEVSWSFLLKESVTRVRETNECIHTWNCKSTYAWLAEKLCSYIVGRCYHR